MCVARSYVRTLRFRVHFTQHCSFFQNDTGCYHDLALNAVYRYITRSDTGVVIWLVACKSFISECKIFFEASKCSYRFEESNWHNCVLLIRMLWNSEIWSRIETGVVKLNFNCVVNVQVDLTTREQENRERRT